MKRHSQRQWLDAIDRALDRAGREADTKYGLKKKSKSSTKPKPKAVKKTATRQRAAAE
ncbi:MAG: hypothetical protein ABL996_03120 [Micropepsaceae bacterium]